MRITELLQEIKPYVLGWIETGGEEGGYAPSPHELDGAHHIGTLSSSQYPDALLRDGSRSLTGNLSVGAGVTIDGVDLSAFKSDYDSHILAADAHHNLVSLDANADAIFSLSVQQLGLDTQAANRVLAGPTSGGAAVPTFRVLAAADIPALGGTPALTFTTSNAAGSASTYIRTDASLAIFDATAPTTIQPDDAAAVGSAAFAARRDHKHAIAAATPGSQAIGDSAAEGTATSFARSDHKHGMPSFATPSVSLGTVAAAGSAATLLRSDCTIVTFDATVPTTIQPDDAAAVGSVAYAARRDHRHAIAAAAPGANSVSLAASAEGSATSFARSDHTHSLSQAITPTWTGLHTFNANVILADNTWIGKETAGSVYRIYPYRSGLQTLDASCPYDIGLTLESDAVIAFIETDENNLIGWMDLNNSAMMWKGTLTLDGDLRFVGPQSITTTTGDLMLAPVGDVTLNPTGAQIRVMASHTLQSDNYASQTTGWGISYVGGADFRYLFADELHVKSFISDLEMALAGGQIISKSVAMLSRAFTAPAAGATATLYVWDLPSAENMAAFQSGDIVRLRTFSRSGGSLTVADCWGVVTSYSNLSGKEQSWTFTRSTSSNAGSMTAGTVVAADSLALDYGTTGNGFYEVNAVDGAYGANSPYSQIVTWATHPATGQTTRVRLGNLYGITAITEYGLFAGEGVSAGDSYLRLTDQNFELHNLDLALYDSGNVQRIGMDAGAGSADKLMWAGTSAVAPQFVVYGDGDVALLNCDLSITDGDFTLQTAASGARFELTSTGIKAYNSSNVQRVKIANDGSGWFGSSSAFTWTTAGAVTATGITVQSAASGGRVVLDASGIAGYSASYKTFALATDGDVFAGSNLGAAATTAFAVFANAQTYNGEAVGAGDVLLGDNSAGKINLLWDMSEGDVLLRRGTSTRIKLDGSTDSIWIGDTSKSWISISSSDMRFWYGMDYFLKLEASGITIGDSMNGDDYISLTSSYGIQLCDGSTGTALVTVNSSGVALGRISGGYFTEILSSSFVMYQNYIARFSLVSGVMTLRDSSGNAVITLDASAGAEITRKLTMPGANSAITIGATPPTSSSAGTGIWIDRTGLYGLSSGTYQVKLQAADGKLFAGAGTVRLDSTGIKLVRGSSVYNKIEWRSSDFSTTYASIYNFLTGTTSELVLYSDAPSGNFGGVRLIAEDGSAVRAEAYLSAYGMTIDGGGLSVSGGLYVGNAGDTAENGVIGIAEISSTPSIISAGNEVHVYLKNNRLIFQFNDSGTVRYKYLNLTGTGVTWVHTTTAP